MTILLAEDNPADVYLIRESLRAYSGLTIEVVCDGEEALDYVFRRNVFARAPRPNLIILDLNLPKTEGSEVLSAIRAADHLRDVPVMILTSSDSPKDRNMAKSLGATCFVTKPSDLDQFMALGSIIYGQLAAARAASVH